MLRRCVAAVGVGVCALFLGCDGNFGRPDDLVPEQRLREVERADLEAWSVAPPTTVPTTGPATRPTTQAVLRNPAAEVHLTIDEARRAALRHNLALQVALLDPTIDREQITQEQSVFESAFVGGVDYEVADGKDDLESGGATVGIDIPLRTGGRVELR